MIYMYILYIYISYINREVAIQLSYWFRHPCVIWFLVGLLLLNRSQKVFSDFQSSKWLDHYHPTGSQSHAFHNVNLWMHKMHRFYQFIMCPPFKLAMFGVYPIYGQTEIPTSCLNYVNSLFLMVNFKRKGSSHVHLLKHIPEFNQFSSYSSSS